jgi:hypothetical protein
MSHTTQKPRRQNRGETETVTTGTYDDDQAHWYRMLVKQETINMALKETVKSIQEENKKSVRG